MNVESDNYKEVLRLTKDLCAREFSDLHDCFFGNSDLDLIFTNPGGGFKLNYYNPDSNAGGQIVECQLEREDLKKNMEGEDLIEVVANGVMPQEYTHKSSAVRAAKRYMEKPGFKCVVS